MQRTQDLLVIAQTYCAATYAPAALIAERGAGSWLWDQDGTTYLDFSGGIGVNVIGHAHPEVVSAIGAQAQRFCHTANGLFHAGAIGMCQRLGQLWPQADAEAQSFLCNSGTEAVEAALKLARRVFFDQGAPRSKFVAMHDGFHGRTMGALSVTGQANYRKGFEPLVSEVEFVPFDDIDSLIRAVTPETAAVIVEPIQGNGGVRMPSAGYMQAVREACDDAGALLIMDEVQTGMGRTGRWFGIEHENVMPDILCLAKALGGGLPLGAIVAPKSLMTSFVPGTHGSTFGGNPVACAAGLATIDVIEREGLLPRAQSLGAAWRQSLQELAQVRKVRGRGFLTGLVCNKSAKAIQAACLKHGLLVTTAGPDVVRLFPPLNASEQDLQEGTLRLAQALQKA